ncbi:Rossmann-like alpha/beta/alpha sandwich fold [Sesbania bispinosa]|nr:Rossmann-like alpha/beta/alpha sandwich fold [Sesbania bispinosa]
MELIGGSSSRGSRDASKEKLTDEKEAFVNHAETAWYQVRAEWVGDQSKKLLRPPRDSAMRNGLCKNSDNVILSWVMQEMIVCSRVNMEIDKAIRECDDRRLQTKYNNATYVIQRALALYSIEEVAFSFNGGKDSTVLLHLLRAGYFLHTKGHNSPNGDLKDFPIRTIYFESPSAFPEINSFTYDTAATYGLQIDTIRLDFKSGLEALLKDNPIRAIFLGVRIGDPTAVGQEQFSPSSPGWPPFMRVNPILDWSYRDVWAFLLTCKVKYCSLYDQGYTSIGSIYDTVPNSLLSISNSSKKFKPAYLLADGRLERAGRVKRPSSTCGQLPVDSNGLTSLDMHKNSMLTASIIAVGDEILFGIVEDQLGPYLCKKLHSVGWSVLQLSVLHNNIDSVAEEVERQKSTTDMVFIYGGVGPLHSDVTLGGIAKAFGVRLAPDEEFEEYLRHIIGDQCTGDRNEMAQLPEGITELLHHDKLSVPLIKCQNVIIVSATNVLELEKQWDCLIELTKSSDLLTLLEPYVSKHVTTNLSDVEVAQPLSKLCLEFPDLYIGCYRKSRYGSVIVSFKGKDQTRLESAIKALEKKFQPGAFTEMN